MNTAILATAVAFLGTVMLTPAVRRLALRVGMVAQPRPDRWAAKPTAKFGGAAIFVAVIAALFVSGTIDRRAAMVMTASAVMFCVGLIDDFWPLAPQHKLVLQTIPSFIVIRAGLVLPWTSYELLNQAFTLFWLIGITNAINLLDNMDGLAAGIAAIGSISLAVTFVRNGQINEAILIVTLCAALLGFLIYNFHPASIFMGDCGSLFIGFFLASAALLAANVGGRSRALLSVVLVPLLTLMIPIFDTTFVAFVRKLAGRSSMTGGRDHTSHRLVALGLHERTAVLLLYALTLLSGGLAIAARDLPYDLSVALTGAVTIVIAIFGFYLAGVKVYDGDAPQQKNALTTFLIDVSYRRPLFQILLDLALITYAYYLAYRLHFGPPDDSADWRRFTDTLPIVVAAKIVTFMFSRLYGGMWRYVSFDDAVVFAKAVVAASVAAVLVLLGVSRFEGLSRIVFVLDALILFALIALTRSSFRVIERFTKRVRSRDAAAIRTLIFGAGDAGGLLLRELRGNRALRNDAVAFFDDDARKAGKALHGLPVYGGDLGRVLREQRIAEIVISTARISPERLHEIVQIAREYDVPLRQMRITIAPVLPTLLVPRPEETREARGATPVGSEASEH